MLNRDTPTANATRGTNTLDNTEEVEIAAPAAGVYKATVKGTAITRGSSQAFALIANGGALGSSEIPCSDSYEPNETSATAFGPVASGNTIDAKACSTTDADFFKLRIDRSGVLTVIVRPPTRRSRSRSPATASARRS